MSALAAPPSVTVAAPEPPVSTRLQGGPAGSVLAWLAAAVAVLGAAQLGQFDAVAVACLAALGSLGLARAVTGRAAATAAAALLLGVAALTPVAIAAIAVLASAALALAAAFSARSVVLRRHDPQRHLDWCRRRQERAQVLVFRCRDGAGLRNRLLDAFRVTDTVTITARDGWCEVEAVVDDHNLSRAGLERRLLSVASAETQLGWAVFPEEGVTLEVLLDAARRGFGGGAEVRGIRPLSAHRVTAIGLQTKPT